MARAIIVVLVLTLFLTGCGDDAGDGATNTTARTGGSGGTTPPADDLDIDACALLTAEDAAEILGAEPIVPLETQSSAADQFLLGRCLWEWQTTEDVFEIGLVQLFIWDGEQFYGEELYEEDEIERLDIGERGYATESIGYDITFLIDGKTVTLGAAGGRNSEGRAALLAAARRIAGELG